MTIEIRDLNYDDAMTLMRGFGAAFNQQAQLDRIERMLVLMSNETKALLERLDAATNAVASRLQTLLDRIDDPEVKTALQAQIDRLEAMGKSETSV